MGDIHEHRPVLLITSAFSQYDAALDWALNRSEEEWGPVVLESPRFEFDETDYYEPTMGAGLKKVFWAYERLIDPGMLPSLKMKANEWEQEYTQQGGHAEERPLNLDPGYMTAAKLVLASTKDHSHRIYLSDGIYAETTLVWQQGGWKSPGWTFPDYRRDDYHQFFTLCRDYLRKREREANRA